MRVYHQEIPRPTLGVGGEKEDKPADISRNIVIVGTDFWFSFGRWERRSTCKKQGR